MPRKTNYKAIELLERRGALRAIWELREGPLGFRALQVQAGARSPTSLSERLKELVHAKLVEIDRGEYRLTREGEELARRLRPLFDWAERAR